MTTATRFFDVDALGFSFIRRGNSVTVVDLGVATLGERLRKGYEGAAIYEPYKETIFELYEAVDRAVCAESDLRDQEKARVRVAMLHAEDFLINRPLRVAAPTVDVWENGRIAFEWYDRPDRIVTATIDELGRLAYAAMAGGERGTGFRMVEGQWPMELIAWIKKVKP
jgi:hypothetical protein